jgi:hypothetical protein
MKNKFLSLKEIICNFKGHDEKVVPQIAYGTLKDTHLFLRECKRCGRIKKLRPRRNFMAELHDVLTPTLIKEQITGPFYIELKHNIIDKSHEEWFVNQLRNKIQRYNEIVTSLHKKQYEE